MRTIRRYITLRFGAGDGRRQGTGSASTVDITMTIGAHTVASGSQDARLSSGEGFDRWLRERTCKVQGRPGFDRSTAGWLQNICAARRYKKNATHGEAVPGEITPTLREPGALEFDVGKTQ